MQDITMNDSKVAVLLDSGATAEAVSEASGAAAEATSESDAAVRDRPVRGEFVIHPLPRRHVPYCRRKR